MKKKFFSYFKALIRACSQKTSMLITVASLLMMAGVMSASGSPLQQKTVVGTITDENGNTMPGVSVVVRGTTLGTLTDAAGKYSIAAVPQDALLVYSFIGMATQEISVNGRSLIDVVMVEEAIGLDEVVVIGYGTQKKVNLTGSVDAVSGEKLQNRAATKVADLIKGTSPNLQINMDMHGVNLVQRAA